MSNVKRLGEWYCHDVIVEGRGDFPVDMLRYDYCVPTLPADADALTSTRARRTIMLVHFSRLKGGSLTIARWNSFGWSARYADMPEGD